MKFGRSAVTTTHERSFAGIVVAHLAVTLVVCGGLVLMLPAPVAANGAPAIASVIPVFDCVASADPAQEQQFSNNASLDAPDSSDDDDDDDAPTGSDAAITVDECRAPTRGDVLHVVHTKVEPWISRAVEGHSLRGPPPDDDDTSSDDDYDGDDNDPTAEISVPLPPPTAGESCPLTIITVVGHSSVRSSGSSLRAPPA
jgi:hypothetical protein